ncbi:helix-turn-helix transcriptional regulator [Arthrobacter mobilis]|uniref:Helix-turn-helix domain-containing protein n=1 Tax=Arthrobacter mobilis TaxID=2724944 RepID=A0A7X6HFK8_9MICC|nr:helix-turn-helix domain-containing protein [Arthrobacter mobilis]NKX56263.1 helix-turn-helix domain-containing protein [Arthrobacter mobilis]
MPSFDSHTDHLPVTAVTAREITGNIYLSRAEAAAYLGLAPKTLAQHRHDGPPYSRFFGAVRYKLADLENWARQQRVVR